MVDPISIATLGVMASEIASATALTGVAAEVAAAGEVAAAVELAGATEVGGTTEAVLKTLGCDTKGIGELLDERTHATGVELAKALGEAAIGFAAVAIPGVGAIAGVGNIAAGATVAEAAAVEGIAGKAIASAELGVRAPAESALSVASQAEITWNSTRLGENLSAFDPRPSEGAWQAHHILPGNVLRDHPLGTEAISRGLYQPDQASNGIWLPNDSSTRLAPANASRVSLPEHRGCHPNYDNAVRKEMNRMLDKVVERHGSLDAAPDGVLSKAMEQVEARMTKHIEHTTSLRIDGRLS